MNSPGHSELPLSCWVVIDEFDSAHTAPKQSTAHRRPRLASTVKSLRCRALSCQINWHTKAKVPSPCCPHECPLQSRLQFIGEAHFLSLQCLMNMPYVCMRNCLPMWRGQELQWWQTMDTCRRTTASLLWCPSAQTKAQLTVFNVCSASWTATRALNMSYVHANNTSKLPTR